MDSTLSVIVVAFDLYYVYSPVVRHIHQVSFKYMLNIDDCINLSAVS